MRPCARSTALWEDKDMKRLHVLLCAASAFASAMLGSMGGVSAQGIPQNIPRSETLILENPEGTIKNAGWFNIWAINAGSQSNGLQQAGLDTLWYIELVGGREADLQRRLYRNDRQAAARHLLERWRRVYGGRRRLHGGDADQVQG